MCMMIIAGATYGAIPRQKWWSTPSWYVNFDCLHIHHHNCHCHHQDHHQDQDHHHKDHHQDQDHHQDDDQNVFQAEDPLAQSVSPYGFGLTPPPSNDINVSLRHHEKIYHHHHCSALSYVIPLSYSKIGLTPPLPMISMWNEPGSLNPLLHLDHYHHHHDCHYDHQEPTVFGVSPPLSYCLLPFNNIFVSNQISLCKGYDEEKEQRILELEQTVRRYSTVQHNFWEFILYVSVCLCLCLCVCMFVCAQGQQQYCAFCLR